MGQPGHRKQLLNMMQFPACVLEDISCHSTDVFLTICHPGMWSDALQLSHPAARDFLLVSPVSI